MIDILFITQVMQATYSIIMHYVKSIKSSFTGKYVLLLH